MIYFKKQDTLINVNHFTALGQYDENYARSYNVFEYGGEIYATWWCAAPKIDALYGGLYRYNPDARVLNMSAKRPSVIAAIYTFTQETWCLRKRWWR